MHGDHVIPLWKKWVITGATLPVFVAFPFALTLVLTTAPQLIFGFDDFPLGWAMLGLVLGVPLALVGTIFVCQRVWNDRLRPAMLALIWSAGFDVLSLPLAFLVTHIVES